MKTRKDLVELVICWERYLAYGSETSLLGAFVNDYGYTDDLKQDETPLAPGEYEAWDNAYKLYEKWEAAGRKFCVGDLF